MESANDASEPGATAAIEDLAYLVRSTNRVRILDALADEPTTRRALAEATGSSRTTLDRIVNEFEDRGWAERLADGRYAATATGRALSETVGSTVDAVVAIRRLGDAVDWLPRDELHVDLAQFDDAHLWRPDGDDPAETGRYFAELVRDVDSLTVLSEWVPPEVLARAMHAEVVAGDLDADFVVTDDVFERLVAEPRRVDRWREMLSATASTWLVDGAIPCNLFVFDDTVLVKASGSDAREESYGVPIQSTNPQVREWALELVDRYRQDATRIDAEPVPR